MPAGISRASAPAAPLQAVTVLCMKTARGCDRAETADGYLLRLGRIRLNLSPSTHCCY